MSVIARPLQELDREFVKDLEQDLTSALSLLSSTLFTVLEPYYKASQISPDDHFYKLAKQIEQAFLRRDWSILEEVQEVLWVLEHYRRTRTALLQRAEIEGEHTLVEILYQVIGSHFKWNCHYTREITERNRLAELEYYRRQLEGVRAELSQLEVRAEQEGMTIWGKAAEEKQLTSKEDQIWNIIDDIQRAIKMIEECSIPQAA